MQLIRENDDYRRLWLAQTFSQIGSQVSYLALPLTAAISLSATPAEMGILAAMGSLPALFVGFFAGAIADRRARRPILVSADAARAFLLSAIPIAWVLGVLSMPLLYFMAVASGICALFFDVAYHAFVPTLARRDQLVAANSGLELSRSAAEVVGPALAGMLIQLLRAPVAIAVDAASFVASALLIARIRAPEVLESAVAARQSLLTAAVEGAREVAKDRSLRALAVNSLAIGLFNAMVEAVVILYLVREIGMEPGLLGIVFTAGSVGFVVGALAPGRIIQWLGIGPAMAMAVVVIGLSDLLLPLVGRNLLLVAMAVAVGQFFFGLGLTVLRVAQVSLRQAIVPDSMLGRVAGTLLVLGWGMAPLGALAGGVLGQTIGLRQTLAIAAILEAAAAILIWRSPLWSIRTIGPVETGNT